LMKCHLVFYSGHSNLYSHQQCVMFLPSPHPWQHFIYFLFLWEVFFMIRWYPFVIFACISLMIGDIEHLFTTYWSFACLSLRYVYYRFFIIFIGLPFGFCYWVAYIFISLGSHTVCKYFLQINILSIHSFNFSFNVQKLLSLTQFYVWFCCLYFQVII
jgi:hypothetical protein